MLPHEHRTFISLFLLMMVVIMLGCLIVLQAPWAPKYPIVGLLRFHPDLITVVAPEKGIIVQQRIPVGRLVQQGDKLIKIKNMVSLISSNFYKKQRIQYANHLEKLNNEVDYQKQRIDKLKYLFEKKLITEALLHRHAKNLIDLQLERENVQQKIQELNQHEWHWIQAPTSGRLLFSYSAIHDLVSKGKTILVIKPKGVEYWVDIQVLPKYQKILYPKQRIKLALPRMTQFSEYPVEAEVVDIAPMVHLNQKKSAQEQGQFYLLVHAKIINSQGFEKFLLPNLPLQGYLIGETKSFWEWMKTMWLLL